MTECLFSSNYCQLSSSPCLPSSSPCPTSYVPLKCDYLVPFLVSAQLRYVSNQLFSYDSCLFSSSSQSLSSSSYFLSIQFCRSIALTHTLSQLHVHARRPELASTEVARANQLEPLQEHDTMYICLYTYINMNMPNITSVHEQYLPRVHALFRNSMFAARQESANVTWIKTNYILCVLQSRSCTYSLFFIQQSWTCSSRSLDIFEIFRSTIIKIYR